MGSKRRQLAMMLPVLFVTTAFASVAGASHDGARSEGEGEVSPAEDNPPGCTKATSESDDGCGAQGRDHFAKADHEAPIEACADAVTETGARITRILPDGPRRDDGTPAFQTGACVYLPPGYGSGALRYPVLYLLHGGGGDQADWLTFGDAAAILDRAYTADQDNAAVAIMPDGRSGQWYDYEDDSYRFEEYVLDDLVPYVDGHFRTIDDRAGRAIAGLSNGGYGSVHFAAKRPDLFVAAGGMSSNLGARTMSGLGESGGVHYQGSVPFQLASNLDGVDVILDIGASCSSDIFVDACATIAVDLAFLPDHKAFAARMDEVGHEGDFDYRETEGAHAWRWWSRWLEERDLPFIFERMAPPRSVDADRITTPIPDSFRYRSIAPDFEVWDHRVTVDRDAREFLDLRGVTDAGFEVQGSGSAVVTTAARHRPGDVYRVAGTGAEPFEVVADTEGRLRIPVDLGPSHADDQFTTAADVAEAAGDYWVVRTVELQATGRATTPPPPSGTPSTGDGAATSPTGDTRADRPRPPSTANDGGTGGGAEGESRRTREVAVGADASATGSAPSLAAFERDPQLVPTVLFLLVLAGGPALWWFRWRRSDDAIEAF